MKINIIITLLFAHFIADFIFQSDWMAINKSKSVTALVTHTITYSFLVGIILALFQNKLFLTEEMFVFISFTWLIHTFQDAITSRINSYLWAKEERHWFFVSIGFDQFLHYIQLIITYKIIYGN
jgi:hypothetical protein